MEPAQFLELLRPPVTPAAAGTMGDRKPSRAYAAVTQSATPEHYLVFHKEGRVQAFPHSSFLAIDGEERGGTAIRINHAKFAIVIEGRQLGEVFEALRTRRAAHLHEFNGGLHDPPEPHMPIVTRIAFGVVSAPPRAKPDATAAPAAAAA